MPTTIMTAVKKKMKKDKLSQPIEGGGRTEGGDIKLKDLVEVAKAEKGDSSKATVTMIAGSCLTGNVTIDGKDPRDMIKEIKEGQHDDLFKE